MIQYTRTKKCKYCRKKFFELDFPAAFERMITCGSVECMGKRRKELWRIRHPRKNHASVNKRATRKNMDAAKIKRFSDVQKKIWR